MVELEHHALIAGILQSFLRVSQFGQRMTTWNLERERDTEMTNEIQGVGDIGNGDRTRLL
ncbi:hypothetical protein Ccrd_011617 [Cynara cardunculus var. scolymus]|uniref:Uncharacterized protein n=1 Tax=Cynara cardunculus var. scolymus TaxID=59895 RepID=A0A103YIZ4_CYNCS|nr:hypothetical protein Ccrd_011617 [Cynara cardunculus var. scolymus]